jgi:hypothetical protein
MNGPKNNEEPQPSEQQPKRVAGPRTPRARGAAQRRRLELFEKAYFSTRPADRQAYYELMRKEWT